MQKTIKEKVIGKIINEKQKPIPKIFFTVRTAILWASFTLMLGLGTIFVSLQIFIYRYGKESIEGIRQIIPFFDMLPVVLPMTGLMFLGIAFISLREARNGCLGSDEKVLVYLLLILVLFTGFLHISGFLEYILGNIYMGKI